MRVAAIVLLAALFSVSEGAVLLRFINTVPARSNLDFSDIGTDSSFGLHEKNRQNSMDRVGIQYFANSESTSAVLSPTYLWTEVVNKAADSAPFAFAMAMPPLRQYHTISSGQNSNPPAVDTVTASTVAQLTAASGTAQTTIKDPSVDDVFDQTFLKADGVGLYLSFAPGTYRMQAYAVLTSTGSVKPLTTSLSTFTFVNNKVYTLVAIGDGAFSMSSPTQGHNVQLKLFEESVDPTTFGKASLRFFHGIKSLSTKNIDIYAGATSTKIASNLAFGALSSYIDVAPTTAFQYPITLANSNTLVAPVSATKFEVTADVRAGMRATVICAVNNDATQSVFCRMIPSRVVAYVRLVNDLAGQASLEQGPAGPVALKDQLLSLYASYELPRPDQLVPGSQFVGSRANFNHPNLNRGLYPVLTKVSSGGCSGYGEVFVPLQIMDFAVRFTVLRNDADLPDAYNGGINAATASNLQNPVTVTQDQWFWGSAMYKRVHVVVKSSGLNTLTGDATTGPTRAPTATVTWPTRPATLDKYVEPGQYYSLIVYSPQSAVAGFSAASLIRPEFIKFAWRLDRSLGLVAAGVPSNQSVVTWISFGDQDFSATQGTVQFHRKNGNINLVPTINNAAGSTLQGITWNTPAYGLTVDPADYVFEFKTVAANPTACLQKIPGSTAVSLTAATVNDIFVFNSFGCLVGSSNENLLSVKACTAASAVANGNAAGTLLSLSPSATSTTAAPTAFFSSASSISSSLLPLFVSALLGLVLAMF